MFQTKEQRERNEFRFFIQGVLHNLWRNQLVMNQEQPLIPLDLYRRKGIFSWFKNSWEFQICYNQAINYVLKPSSDEELRQIMQRFTGKAHQYLAYNLLAAESQNEGNLLLDPYNSLIFYEALFFAGSTGNRISNLFGDIGLNHKSVPDGLVLQQVGKEINIKEIIEYTLFGDPEKFSSREAAFLADQQEYPDIFDGTRLRFVVPGRFHQPRYKHGEALNIKAEFSEIPITYRQYRNFTQGIFYYYQGLPVLSSEEQRLGGENLTLIELLHWARVRKHDR